MPSQRLGHFRAEELTKGLIPRGLPRGRIPFINPTSEYFLLVPYNRVTIPMSPKNSPKPPSKVIARLKKLKETVEHHRYLYHVLDREEISAEALDSLKNELREIEEKYPALLTPDSPSQRVAGEPLPQFEKVI